MRPQKAQETAARVLSSEVLTVILALRGLLPKTKVRTLGAGSLVERCWPCDRVAEDIADLPG